MIRKAIEKLRPNAEYTIYGDTYSGLVWNDINTQKPTESEVIAAIALVTQAEQFKAIEIAVEQHMDAVAKSDGWDSRWTCVARAGYVNPWQQKGINFGQWMDNCWAIVIQGQRDVAAGTRAMPTPEQAIAELPVLVW